jgi:hypothetical protein
MARASSASLFRAISGGGSRQQVMASPRYVPRASVQMNRGPIVSRNNTVAVNHYANVNNMLNNRMYTRGYAVASPRGYDDSHNQMRNLVHMGEGFRVSVRDAMNRDLAMRNRPPIIITRPRAVGATGGQPGATGGVVNNSWRAQQNNAGLGRNRGYSSGMSQFAINSANSGLNKMR